ncbi:MAG: hypothetical protein WCH43_17395, partial [Verrucomicrobiota bacterium]
SGLVGGNSGGRGTVTVSSGTVLPNANALPAGSSLSLAFEAQAPNAPTYPFYSPTPPGIVFETESNQTPADPFTLDASANPAPLRPDRVAQVVLSPDLVNQNGFSHLDFNNSDGNITIPTGVSLTAAPGGAIKFTAANLDIEGSISAPGGSLSFTVTDFTPFTQVLGTLDQSPSPDSARGNFLLGSTASLSTAGLVVNDLAGSPAPGSLPLATVGGTITIKSYSADLLNGSSINVSGGLEINPAGQQSYGSAGSIVIKAGQDPAIPSLLGGHLLLESDLKGYAGTGTHVTGGNLKIQAPLIQIGGVAPNPDTLLLSPDFFNRGGFVNFAITGLGAPTGTVFQYLPAISISPGTLINPVSQNWSAVPDPINGGVLLNPSVLQQGVRNPVSLAFGATGVRDSFSSSLIVRGDLVMGTGSVIRTDPQSVSGGGVSFSGDTVAILGTVIAPGGTISLTGAQDSGVLFANQTQALATIDLAPGSLLSTAGVTLLTPDSSGHNYRTGTVLN